MQALPALATKAENSKQSCCFLTIILCHLPKSFSILKFITLTSVRSHLVRQSRPHLPRYLEEELVARPADEISAALNPKFAG